MRQGLQAWLRRASRIPRGGLKMASKGHSAMSTGVMPPRGGKRNSWHKCFYLQHNGHKEDILSVAQSPPNMLATSSYDGEVIVWNMVSGHIFCHLHAPAPEGYEDQSCE